MHALYVASVFIHILAAMTWLGGMFFLVLVVVPWLRGSGGVDAAKFLRETGMRFRDVGWACFVLLVVTGTFNLYVRGVRLGDFTDATWLASDYGRVIVAKLGLFVLVLVNSAVHDFVIGPRATTAIALSPTSSASAALRKKASMLGRMNVVFGLVIVLLAVFIVRGVP